MNEKNDRNHLKEVFIKIPHRISGFFQMMNPVNDLKKKQPSQIGSCGGGPSLTAYGKTHIKLLDNSNTDNSLNYEIWINGKNLTLQAVTSSTTLRLMEEHLPKFYKYRISHEFDLPLGAGYGSSGSGALGIAIGIKKILNLPFSFENAAYYAHAADVLNHTGLGTVGGQYAGGLSIMMEPGFPFKYNCIPIDSDIRILTGSFGPLSTKEILTNPDYKKLIYHVGQRSMQLMKQEYTLENYLKVVQFFLKKTQILKKLKLSNVQKCLEIINQTSAIGSGMNQLGRSFFAFCYKEDVNEIQKLLRERIQIEFIDVVKVEKENFIQNTFMKD